MDFQGGFAEPAQHGRGVAACVPVRRRPVDLGPVRTALRDLGVTDCFWCGARLRHEVHVDHVLPWSQFPTDALFNLVLSDPGCNLDKRDTLVTPALLDRWVARPLDPLQQAADSLTLAPRPPRNAADCDRRLHLPARRGPPLGRPPPTRTGHRPHPQHRPAHPAHSRLTLHTTGPGWPSRAPVTRSLPGHQAIVPGGGVRVGSDRNARRVLPSTSLVNTLIAPSPHVSHPSARIIRARGPPTAWPR